MKIVNILQVCLSSLKNWLNPKILRLVKDELWIILYLHFPSLPKLIKYDKYKACKCQMFQVLSWRVSARPHDRPEAGHRGGVRGLRPQTGRGQGVCQVSGRAGVIGNQWPTTCDNWTSWDLWHKWHSHDPGSSLGMGVRLCLAPPTSAPCASCTMTQTRDSSTVRGAGYAGGMSKILLIDKKLYFYLYLLITTQQYQ